mgnify:CR=1 FL=1
MAENITAHMDKSLESLKHNFSKVRTGRANANILSDITVDYYGVPTPVTQVAAVKTPEAHMLLIEPWDKALINAIVKAIGASDLGITPNSDGTVVRLPFPAPRSAVANSSRSAASTPSRPRCLSVTSVATSTISSSAMRSSPRTMSVASRPRSRSTPMSMSPRLRSF